MTNIDLKPFSVSILLIAITICLVNSCNSSDSKLEKNTSDKNFLKNMPPEHRNETPVQSKPKDTIFSAESNLDEIWTDEINKKMWQIYPSEKRLKWEDAKNYCSELTLGGYDDWHLPSITELRSLIRGCVQAKQGGECKVSDSCLSISCWNKPTCEACSTDGYPIDGCYWPTEIKGACGWYWSSSRIEDVPQLVWNVAFNLGYVLNFDFFYRDNTRCVRSVNKNN